MMPLYRPFAITVIIGTTAAGLLACGGGRSRPTNTPTPSSKQSSATPTASAATDNALILHAFEASVVAFDVAVREMNPDDPGIPATTTGDQVVHDLTTLNSWKTQRITAKGDLPHIVDSRVVSRTATSATVRACVYDPGVLIYKDTGAIVPTNVAGQFYVDTDATLELVGGVWKVSRSSTQTEVSGCLPGY